MVAARRLRVVILPVVDGAEKRHDLLLFEVLNVLHKRLGDRRPFRAMTTESRGSHDQPVVNLQVR